MNNLKFFDSTLRDGSHAVRHQLSLKAIEDYCTAADDIGFYVVTVGHGNGMGASSLQIGLAAHPDLDMLQAAKARLRRTKLGAFLIPGFGTIKDNVAPALEAGVDVVCVASHCTEADVTQQHIEYVRSRNKEAYGILMMYHMALPETILEQAKKMQSYGAMGVILMDSAGSSTPPMVKETITLLAENLEVPVGFHAHNNLGMAVSNTLTALDAGASIVDGTVRGFGAGAGNCQLEALAALMQKLGKKTGLDLFKLLDASDVVAKEIMQKPQDVDPVSIIGGLAGVFSGFSPHVRKAAEKYGVDSKEIFLELGRRKVVGGQEDIVVEVALELAKKKARS